MRFGLATLTVAVTLSGCAVGAGAGASARLGSPYGPVGAGCDSFESCDIAHRDAVANAERCHREADADDCEATDRDVAASYEVLYEATARELETLRTEAQVREGALNDAEQAADAARLEEQNECARKGHPLAPPPPTVQRGSGWFESDSGMH